jgi:hypothetical protein
VEDSFDRFLVGDRQGAGETETDRAAHGIWLSAEGDRAPAEHLGLRLQLDMGLQADDGFP